MAEEKAAEEVGEDIRTIRKIGASYYISIPPNYISEQNVKDGDRFRVFWRGNLLHAEPISNEELKERIEKVEEV